MSVLYVPILKRKEGEYGALEVLGTGSRNVIVPLIEVPNVPYDFANERPARSLDDHVSGIADRLRRCWAGMPFYLDMPWFGEDETLEDGTVAIGHVLRKCAENDLGAIPVVRTSSSEDYLKAVRSYLAELNGSFCLRLVEADFDEEGEADPTTSVARLLEAIGVNNLATTDLILDLGDVGPDVGRATLVARSVLAQTPRAAEWRRLVLAAASFPENLSELSAATTSRLPRVEWHLWERLRRRGISTRRDIVFGDYAIAHPIPTELDPRTMRMSASIRYTIPDEWLILKGRNVREHGFDQYFELSRQLVQLPDYSGEEFSWADRWIMRCARREIGPGNATTWRKVGTNHHRVLVARDLANADPAV